MPLARGRQLIATCPVIRPRENISLRPACQRLRGVRRERPRVLAARGPRHFVRLVPCERPAFANAKMAELPRRAAGEGLYPRSEEHTSELQSRQSPVCRLLLEKKKPPGRQSR